MAITLSNKTDAELKKEVSEAGLIPKNAIVDFEILPEVTFGTKTYYTEDAQSKAGNDMIVLVVNTFYGENQSRVIVDYLTANNPHMEFKLRHALASVGLSGASISAKDFIGKTGKCKIGIQKDKTGEYADKNTIQDYVERGVLSSQEAIDSIPDFN